ncbi:MAG: ZIP family metal transporter [Saprospiraceae bacterium]|nr:ZIP family metal transporter [Saprospiraceae bacterium]
MEIWQYILLFGAVLAGGGLAFWFKSHNRRLLQLVLSFVGAYLLGILVLHLIPDAYSSAHVKHVGWWVLAGFFIQLTLEQFSMGVEHGHIHDHHHTNRPMFALQVVVSLSIHAFIEGLPLSNHEALHDWAGADHHSNQLYYGVILHKAPEAFALALLLLMSHFSKRLVAIYVFCFAAMSPLGAFLTQSITFSTETLQKMIAVVIGSLLHISTTILFEIDNTDEHRISIQKIMAIVIGVGLAIFTNL